MRKCLSHYKVKRIIASGCSFTYGFGLEDQNLAWPNQLASLLQVDCINLGLNGAGNEHVVNSIIDYFAANPDHIQDSFVAIGFSSFLRVEFLLKNSTKVRYTNPSSKLEPNYIKTFYMERFNKHFYYLKYLRLIIALTSFLKQQQIPHIFFDCLINPHCDFIKDKMSQDLIRLIDHSNGFGFLTDNFKTVTNKEYVLPDGHPDDRAYKQFAELLYKHLINNYGVFDV
jgi:hypothetical protein